MHDLPDVLNMLEALPDRIDRRVVAEAVSAELEAGRVLPGFVAAMVWGWGDKGGRGAVRTRWILTCVKGPAMTWRPFLWTPPLQADSRKARRQFAAWCS